MKFEPMKPTLKAPGPKHLKAKYDKLLSNAAFKFKLRRYTWVARAYRRRRCDPGTGLPAPTDLRDLAGGVIQNSHSLLQRRGPYLPPLLCTSVPAFTLKVPSNRYIASRAER